jgi:tripartite-type tricarboxylate transporter receptor subunit TctC
VLRKIKAAAKARPPACRYPSAHIQKAKKRQAMKLRRRQFLRLAGAAIVAAPAGSRVAWAQAYPTRPVRVVAGYPPGGLADLLARLIGQSLSERFGKQFIVENRAGAAGSLAAESVARAPPDGYTLLLTTATDAWNTAVYDNLRFDYLRDVVPVASIARGMCGLVVNPSFPAKSVPELIAYAKSNKISLGSGGVGSASHICGALFSMLAGVEMVHVPYRGEALALTDLLGGQVHVAFPTIPSVIEFVRAGRLRALAVTAATRAPVLPDVPTMDEFVRGYEVSGWAGIGAPRNTPIEIVDRLNREINVSLANSALKQRIAELGDTVSASSPAEFGNSITEFTGKWAKVIRAMSIKAA